MFKHTLIAGLAGALIATSPVCADDDIDAEAYIKYRENLMDSILAHRKGVSAILKGKVAAKAHLVRHARSLHELSMMLPEAFPEGSDFGETRAKENIWEDTDAFGAALKEFQQTTAALVETTGRTDDPAAVGEAMKRVGGSCKDCHKRFRSKK